jgi:hemoglobin
MRYFKRVKNVWSVISVLLLMMLAGCVSPPKNDSLYQALGKQQGIARISRNFIHEIGADNRIRSYFENADLKRFHAKLTEHICHLSGGGCAYTGDTMRQVHGGMNVTEMDFNRTVDLLINAMNKEGIPHPVQNRLLKVLAPLYEDIVYL